MASLLEFLFELLFEITAELFGDSGLRAAADAATGRRSMHPVLALVVLGLWGVLIGWGTTLVAPEPVFDPLPVPGISLVVAPVLTGLATAAAAALRHEHGMRIFRLDRFGYGFVFALALTSVRFGLVT